MSKTKRPMTKGHVPHEEIKPPHGQFEWRESGWRSADYMVAEPQHDTWSPNLNTNGSERIYIFWGKTNLTDDVEWMCPTNSGHRFFKVEVELP